MNYSRFLGSIVLACTILLLSSAPAAPAAKPPGKKTHAPKKKAPKPKHQAKHKAKPKSHQGAHKKAVKKHNNKKKHPKAKHHAKHHVKPKSHKPPHTRKPQVAKKDDAKKVRAARTHTRIASRTSEWSKHSSHEHTWSHNHWHTHHFAHFHGDGNNPGFHFDGGWWNNYVANPGTPNWSENAQGVSEPLVLPGVAKPVPPGPPLVVKIDQGLPISNKGEALARLLDSMRVESRWLANQEVEWKTGLASDPPVGGPASNGGAFVAAVCNQLKLSIPASGIEDFLPGNQIDWFLNVGKEKGWVKVGEVESQALANQGWVVVAAWQNMASAGQREISGRVAIVRPDSSPVTELAERGPLVVVAGPQNFNRIGLKDGFPAGAWSKQEVVYLAHRSR